MKSRFDKNSTSKHKSATADIHLTLSLMDDHNLNSLSEQHTAGSQPRRITTTKPLSGYTAALLLSRLLLHTHTRTKPVGETERLSPLPTTHISADPSPQGESCH